MTIQKHFRPLLATLALVLSATAPVARAENWAQWRGPNFNGSTAEANLPVSWSKTENVAWTAPLPGPSGSTPVIWGDHVFVSSPDAQKNLLLLCFDRTDGKLRWQKTVAIGDKKKGDNNMTSPSPVTDGRRVFVLYGTSDLAAFDFDGKEIWSRTLGKDFGRFSVMWIYGSSPLLHQGRLYIQVLQRDPPPNDYPSVDDKPTRESYLLCLDPNTGKDLWRQVRQTDSTKESQEAYSTPMPHHGKNGDEIVVVGGDHASGHRADTGAELWRARLYEKRDDWYRIVTTPVSAGDLIIACGPKGQPVVALKDGAKGDVTGTGVAWSFSETPTDWSTPLNYNDRLFVLDGDRRVLTCLNPKTGEKLWQGNLGTSDRFWSSPTGADGKIYCLSEEGTVVVLDAGNEFKILATIKMEEAPCRSTIAAAHGQLFIRTAQTLYCIARRP